MSLNNPIPMLCSLLAVLLLNIGAVASVSAQTPAPGGTPTPAATSAPTVDHGRFDALLRAHVHDGFVDYDAFAKSPEFAAYLQALERAQLSGLSEDERLAFWINTFNAYTIQLIVSHGETKSIRNVNKSFGFLQLKGPWSEPLVRAAGRVLTLDDVQHTILRKEFAEPRVHFAMACGAIGCASLRNEAYVGEKLVEQLNQQARVFLRESPNKNRLEPPRANRGIFWMLTLSPVIAAYRSDFGQAREDLGRALAPYFEGESRKALQSGQFVVRVGSFDWALNSTANATKKSPS